MRSNRYIFIDIYVTQTWALQGGLRLAISSGMLEVNLTGVNKMAPFNFGLPSCFILCQCWPGHCPHIALQSWLIYDNFRNWLLDRSVICTWPLQGGFRLTISSGMLEVKLIMVYVYGVINFKCDVILWRGVAGGGGGNQPRHAVCICMYARTHTRHTHTHAQYMSIMEE